MLITVSSHKGGVGKTVSAVHLAGVLGERDGPGSTLLVDTDENRSAWRWWQRGSERGLPFDAVVGEEAAGLIDRYRWVVVDTPGRVRGEDLERIVDACDLLVVPSMTDPIALEGTMVFLADLEDVGPETPYRVLLTAVPGWWRRSGRKARHALENRGIPMFRSDIRHRVAFHKAAQTGSLVRDADDARASDGWEDYRGVGREVMELS